MPPPHPSASLLETSLRLAESLPERDRPAFLTALSDLAGVPPAGRPVAVVPSGIQRALTAGTELADAVRTGRTGRSPLA